jgi:hypothetical protein
MRKGSKRAVAAGSAEGAGGGDDAQAEAAERLTVQLARLRANFGADPATARASFDGAWTPPTAAMEEDEAEFIDAVADCMGAGLPLDAALECWDGGRLCYDEDAASSGGEEDDARESFVAEAHHAHPGARRLLMT